MHGSSRHSSAVLPTAVSAALSAGGVLLLGLVGAVAVTGTTLPSLPEQPGLWRPGGVQVAAPPVPPEPALPSPAEPPAPVVSAPAPRPPAPPAGALAETPDAAVDLVARLPASPAPAPVVTPVQPLRPVPPPPPPAPEPTQPTQPAQPGARTDDGRGSAPGGGQPDPAPGTFPARRSRDHQDDRPVLAAASAASGDQQWSLAAASTGSVSALALSTSGSGSGPGWTPPGRALGRPAHAGPGRTPAEHAAQLAQAWSAPGHVAATALPWPPVRPLR